MPLGVLFDLSVHPFKVMAATWLSIAVPSTLWAADPFASEPVDCLVNAESPSLALGPGGNPGVAFYGREGDLEYTSKSGNRSLPTRLAR